MLNTRNIACATLALALLVWIILSAARLKEIADTDARMDEVEELLQAESLGEACDGLEHLARMTGLTRKQEQRFTELTELTGSTVTGFLDRRHPIRRIGALEFKPDEGHEVVVGINPVRVTARIEPREMGRLVRSIRIGAELAAVEGDTAFAQLSLSPSGTPQTIPVVAVVSLPGGKVMEHPVGDPLVVRFDPTPPAITVAVGDDEPVTPDPAGTTTLVATYGRPMGISISDPHGLREARWSAEVGEDAFQFPLTRLGDDLPRSRKVVVPKEITHEPGSHRIVVVAVNSLGTRHRVPFQVDVKGQRWFPVKNVRLSDTPLEGNETVVKGTRHELVITLPEDVLTAFEGLTVRTDQGEAVPLQQRGRKFRAEIQLNSRGKTGVSVMRGETVLRTWLVRSDNEGPQMVLLRTGGQRLEANGELWAVPPGAALRLELQDHHGIAAKTVELEGQGIHRTDVPEAGPASSSTCSIALRVDAGARGTISVRATDQAGNATHREWNVRALVPLQITECYIHGTRVGTTPIPIRRDEVQVRVGYEGEGPIAFLLKDGASGETLQHLRVDSSLGGQYAIAQLPLFLHGAVEGERRVEVRDAAAGNVACSATLRIDRAPPLVRIGDWSSGADGHRASIEATPGSRISVVIEEPDAAATVTVTGAVILSRSAQDDRVTLAVGVPETLPAELVIRARDPLGNQRDLTVKLVKPSVIAPVIINLIRDGKVVVQEGPLMVKRVSELGVQVRNGALLGCSMGGTDLPIQDDGSLRDPVNPPADGPFLAVVRDDAGDERTVPFDVVLKRYTVPQELRDRVNEARGHLDAGRREVALKALESVAKELRRTMAEFLDSGESRHLLAEVIRLKERTDRVLQGHHFRSRPAPWSNFSVDPATRAWITSQ